MVCYPFCPLLKPSPLVLCSTYSHRAIPSPLTLHLFDGTVMDRIGCILIFSLSRDGTSIICNSSIDVKVCLHITFLACIRYYYYCHQNNRTKLVCYPFCPLLKPSPLVLCSTYSHRAIPSPLTLHLFDGTVMDRIGCILIFSLSRDGTSIICNSSIDVKVCLHITFLACIRYYYYCHQNNRTKLVCYPFCPLLKPSPLVLCSTYSHRAIPSPLTLHLFDGTVMDRIGCIPIFPVNVKYLTESPGVNRP